MTRPGPRPPDHAPDGDASSSASEGRLGEERDRFYLSGLRVRVASGFKSGSVTLAPAIRDPDRFLRVTADASFTLG
jgi:hypothetical protein